MFTDSYMGSNMNWMGKQSRSVAVLPTINSRKELAARKQKQEYDMGYVMRRELEQNSMKKLTQQKYEMLMKHERDQMQLNKIKKVKKQEEMRKLHDMIQFERNYKSEKEQT